MRTTSPSPNARGAGVNSKLPGRNLWATRYRKSTSNLKSRHWPSGRSAGKSQLIEENNSVRGPTTSAKSESNRGSIFNDLYHQLAKTQGLEQSWLLFVWKKSINSPRFKIADFIDFSRIFKKRRTLQEKKKGRTLAFERVKLPVSSSTSSSTSSREERRNVTTTK